MGAGPAIWKRDEQVRWEVGAPEQGLDLVLGKGRPGRDVAEAGGRGWFSLGKVCWGTLGCRWGSLMLETISMKVTGEPGGGWRRYQSREGR